LYDLDVSAPLIKVMITSTPIEALTGVWRQLGLTLEG
jgi:hypothetical protein